MASLGSFCALPSLQLAYSGAGLALSSFLLSLFHDRGNAACRIPWRPVGCFRIGFYYRILWAAYSGEERGSSKDVSLAENVPALVEEFQIYIGGPLVASITFIGTQPPSRRHKTRS